MCKYIIDKDPLKELDKEDILILKKLMNIHGKPTKQKYLNKSIKNRNIITIDIDLDKK